MLIPKKLGMEKRRVIATDIDEVLAELIEAFLTYHNKNYNTDFRKKDIFNYNLHKVFGYSQKVVLERFERFYKSEDFKNLKPVNDSQEVIEKLSKDNDIIIITARSEGIAEQTKEWLHKYFNSNFKHIHFMNTTFDSNTTIEKADICLEYGANIFIEDSYKNATNAAKKGIKSYLYTQPWNQNKNHLHSNLVRVYSWNDLLGELSTAEESENLEKKLY
jgi:uncharacterized HAD superfamily protein